MRRISLFLTKEADFKLSQKTSLFACLAYRFAARPVFFCVVNRKGSGKPLKQRRDSKQRRMILDLVHQHSDHPSADQIYLEARSINDKISRGTVYRNLDVLVQDNQISMVKMHGINRYDWKLQPHYHFALFCMRRCHGFSDDLL